MIAYITLQKRFFSFIWLIYQKQYGTKYFWKLSNNLYQIIQITLVCSNVDSFPSTIFKYPVQRVNAKDCGDFGSLRLHRCIGYLKNLGILKNKEHEEGADFWVYSTLEQCLLAFYEVESLKGRPLSILPSHWETA